MAGYADRGMLSIGAFLIILVISIVLGAFVIGWWLVPSLIMALSGCWVLVLAWMQSSNPQKYERSAFGLLGWGLLLIAVGGAWFLYSFNWLYSIALILLVMGALAIATAFRRK